MFFATINSWWLYFNKRLAKPTHREVGMILAELRTVDGDVHFVKFYGRAFKHGFNNYPYEEFFYWKEKQMISVGKKGECEVFIPHARVKDITITRKEYMAKIED